MAEPNPSNVAPWYLRDMCQALELDPVSGNVFIRTGIQGNVYITGPVSVPGLVTITGNANITSMPPITGNVNANITGGNSNVVVTTLPPITGNVNANVTALPPITGNVNANITGGNSNVIVTGNIAGITALPPITGNVNANITSMPPIAGNVNANITGGNSNVTVTGNVAVTQATTPWVVTGNLTTAPSSAIGDFYGEPYAIPITPVVQTYGTYGINPQDHQVYTSGGGSATTTNSCFIVSSTSTVGSYAVLRSRRFNTYKPGQSLLARFYAKMTTPVSGTSQRIGLQNQESGYYVGYNGTTFGVLQVHNSKAPIYEVTITSYTGNQTVTLTLNGTAYTVAIVNGESTDNAAQRISQINFGGLWLANQRDNTVELLYTGVGPLAGTFSVASTGNLVSAIVQQQAGVAATNTWYLDGTDFTKPTWLDPTKFNQYQMKYSWAGINFFALNPSSGQYELFYQLIWAGSALASELPVTNPAFKIAALAINAGGSTPVTVYVASMMSGLEGITNRNNYTGAAATTQASLSQNVLHHLVSIQNPYTFNNTINTKEALLEDLTVSMQCNDPTEVYIYLDSQLATGLQDFKSQNGYSVTVSDVTGTVNPATNYPICSFIVGITGSSVQFDLSQYRVAIPPGSTATIAVLSTASIQQASASVVWYND